LDARDALGRARGLLRGAWSCGAWSCAMRMRCARLGARQARRGAACVCDARVMISRVARVGVRRERCGIVRRDDGGRSAQGAAHRRQRGQLALRVARPRARGLRCPNRGRCRQAREHARWLAPWRHPHRRQHARRQRPRAVPHAQVKLRDRARARRAVLGAAEQRARGPRARLRGRWLSVEGQRPRDAAEGARAADRYRAVRNRRAALADPR